MERMRNGWWQAGSVSTLTGYGMTLPAIRVSQMRLPEISLPPLTRNQAECGPASLSLLRSPRMPKTTKFSNKRDRKSTRLNSSHVSISYAVFCLKKKRIHHHHQPDYTQCDHTLCCSSS